MPIQTPFKPIHERLGANFAEFDGWSLPADFGDLPAENTGLYTSSAVFDLSSFARINLKGEGAKKLLDYLLATNIHNLSNDKWIWSMICDENGNLASIVRVAQTNNAYHIFTPPSARNRVIDLINAAARITNTESTQIDDITEKTGMLALYGPKAVETLDAILPFDITEITPGAIKIMSFFMISVTIIRGSWLGTDGIELICPQAACAMAAGALAKYRDRLNIAPAGMKTLKTAIMESSLPLELLKHPQCKKISPVALSMTKMIDMEKDFQGKEAIAKELAEGTKTVLMGVKTPKIGKEHTNIRILCNDKEIGKAEIMLPSQNMNCDISLAMIDTQYADLADEIQIVSDDIISGGELIKLPFDNDLAAGIYA
ncbi:MAG: aminomethyl transferase family protein [Planctomycetes bacterium]|nr:aminomethyl transferase family protein [Planctomycetota bacterium]